MKQILGFLTAVLVVGAAATTFLGGDDDAPLTLPESLDDHAPFRYPLELWDRRAEGEVLLMVRVSDMGTVDSAYVLISSGEPAFDSAALAGAPGLRFTPARRGDDRIPMWVRQPVRFRMPGDSVSGR